MASVCELAAAITANGRGCGMIVRLLCRRGSCHRGIDREAGPTDQTNREVTCGTDEEES